MEELSVGQHFAGVSEQDREKGEFVGGEVNQRAIYGDFSARKVHAQGANFHHGLGG
jgi:hypothetical protein